MLNAHYAALRVISARRALSLLFKRNCRDLPVAEIVHVEGDRYVSYDFDDWVELSEIQRECDPGEFDWICAVRFYLAIPKVIRVLTYSKVNKQILKLNRRTILARDKNRCQYCAKKFPPSELSLDHVVPRSQNGPLSWDNIVCCCLRCNVRKGGRTPEKAGMRLLTNPIKPKRSPVLTVKVSDRKYSAWRHFLDQAQWQVSAN